MGFREPARRSTLADANETRDWRSHAAFAQRLIARARKLYADEDLGLDLANSRASYKSRWQAELFFTWIKQHLRIKKSYGTSENAVRAQIWIAVSAYVLVAIVKKRLDLDASLCTLLQILSLALFEKMPILQALSQDQPTSDDIAMDNQLNLFAS